MEQQKIEIDLAAVAREALRDRKPGEDLDVALLRICKDLYGRLGLPAFQTVRQAAEAYSTQTNASLEAALQDIASGKSATTVTAFSRTFTTEKSIASLDELPAEMRQQAQAALESGKRQEFIITNTFSGNQGLASLLGFVLRLFLGLHKQPRAPKQPGAATPSGTAPQPAAITQPTPLARPGTARCEHCKLEYSIDRFSCPGCGTERKRSFWARLFGN